MMLVYKDFSIGMLQSNPLSRNFGFHTIPPYFGLIINRFICLFDSIEKIDQIKKKIERTLLTGENEDIGDNDFSVVLTKTSVIFDLLWDKPDDEHVKHYPLKISLKDFEDFLDEFKTFILTYESCKIPGVIPASKLDSWTCVPNEYVKEEYWEILKKEHRV